MTSTSAKVEQLQQSATTAAAAAASASASAAETAAAARSLKKNGLNDGVNVTSDLDTKLELLQRELAVMKLKVDALAAKEVRPRLAVSDFYFPSC
jgi:hypothetical protein